MQETDIYHLLTEHQVALFLIGLLFIVLVVIFILPRVMEFLDRRKDKNSK